MLLARGGASELRQGLLRPEDWELLLPACQAEQVCVEMGMRDCRWCADGVPDAERVRRKHMLALGS